MGCFSVSADAPQCFKVSADVPQCFRISTEPFFDQYNVIIRYWSDNDLVSLTTPSFEGGEGELLNKGDGIFDLVSTDKCTFAGLRYSNDPGVTCVEVIKGSSLKRFVLGSFERTFPSIYSLTQIILSDYMQPVDMSHMFRSIENLERIDGLSNVDTSNVENMSYMFGYLYNITQLDVSGFNTEKVTDFSGMFNSCYRLKSLDVSGFNTSQASNMAYMFRRCTDITFLDCSNFDFSTVTDMSYMFYQFRSTGDPAAKILLPAQSPSANMTHMFYASHFGCISHISTVNATNTYLMFTAGYNDDNICPTDSQCDDLMSTGGATVSCSCG